MARRGGLRVIAGTARGLRLEAPAGLGTRPVTDRVKESVFGTLEPTLRDAQVLDLYAGSGAMAIEALSRGAAAAVLVERDPGAVEVIRRNLRSTQLDRRAEVHRADVRAHLRRRPDRGFDVVFCDPPYDAPGAEVEGVLTRLASGWVVPGATVVLRRRTGGPPPDLPPGWRFPRTRTFGDTLVLFISAGQE